VAEVNLVFEAEEPTARAAVSGSGDWVESSKSAVADGLIDDARRDRSHRVLIARWIFQSNDFERLLLDHARRDADFLFRKRPQRLKLAVRERPINTVAVLRVKLDIVLELAQRSAEPVPGRAAAVALVSAGEL